MTQTDKTDAALEEFFAAARMQADAPVSDDLLARIQADAIAAAVPAAAPKHMARVPWYRALFASVGGLPAAAAFAACTAFGVGIGAAVPVSDYLTTSIDLVLTDADSGIYNYSELVTDIDTLWAEG